MIYKPEQIYRSENPGPFLPDSSEFESYSPKLHWYDLGAILFGIGTVILISYVILKHLNYL